MIAPRILINNLVDIGSVSANPALVATLSESNLQLPQRMAIARTTGVSSQDYKFSWGSAQRVNMVALRYHNLTTAAQMAVVLYSDPAWTTAIGGGTYTAANCFAYTGMSNAVNLLDPQFKLLKNSARYLTLATNVQSIKVTITDANNPDGFFDISRMFIGEYWSIQKGLTFSGFPTSLSDMSIQQRADSGFLNTDMRARFARFGINLDLLTLDVDYKEFMAAVMNLGLSKDFWLSVFPEDGTIYEMYNQNACKLTSIPDLDRYSPLYFKSQLKIEST